MKTFELSEAKKNQLASEIAQRILDEKQISQAVDGEQLQSIYTLSSVNQFLLFRYIRCGSCRSPVFVIAI